MLSNDLEQSTATLQLTAPDFFLFAEDCREGLHVTSQVQNARRVSSMQSPLLNWFEEESRRKRRMFRGPLL